MPTNKAKQGKGTEVSRIGCHPPITHTQPPNHTHTGPSGAGLKESCRSVAKAGDHGAVYASGLTWGGISSSVYRRISQQRGLAASGPLFEPQGVSVLACGGLPQKPRA